MRLENNSTSTDIIILVIAIPRPEHDLENDLGLFDRGKQTHWYSKIMIGLNTGWCQLSKYIPLATCARTTPPLLSLLKPLVPTAFALWKRHFVLSSAGLYDTLAYDHHTAMADTQVEDFTSLPLSEKLAHKVSLARALASFHWFLTERYWKKQSWKARQQGYDELKTVLLGLEPGDSPEYKKWQDHLKKMALDANVVAQESGLNVISVFVEQASVAVK
jgi:hypothetical protein